ncbi:hypothetical protein LVB77_14735 [Lysobacter sp. 5GHs7-4]|uniref:hypothetical protein n=1 Tax=Lysobacter sp. 5GHs7-4 TaxID=2904253 RepID=UPI001E4898FD|nr:hypothetical protein [Lysobacter sp. 5GHs7-4]UHQ21922.1 hypothetical protein LVB77_14735 [Lysobacter sp. 5GHs7-4]
MDTAYASFHALVTLALWASAAPTLFAGWLASSASVARRRAAFVSISTVAGILLAMAVRAWLPLGGDQIAMEPIPIPEWASAEPAPQVIWVVTECTAEQALPMPVPDDLVYRLSSPSIQIERMPRGEAL